MNKADMMFKVATAQCHLLKAVSELSAVERQLNLPENKTFEISEQDIYQLKEGFTITVLGGGTVIRLRLKGDQIYA